jgi:outer membrane protein OmpA-like peptidoglycan-associated protein
MENQRTISRYSLAGAAMALLSACGAAPVAVAPPTPLRPVQLGITQVGNGQTTRYVYCEESACPSPTAKTPVVQFASMSLPANDATARVAPATGLDSVDVTFSFNSSRLSEPDKNLLTQAAAAHPGAHVELTARSDFVGPPVGQRKVVIARAKAMRRIVAKQAQGAQITERREVAGPDRVAEAEQAQQRRGTVRFNRPIDVQLKGSPK